MSFRAFWGSIHNSHQPLMKTLRCPLYLHCRLLKKSKPSILIQKRNVFLLQKHAGLSKFVHEVKNQPKLKNVTSQHFKDGRCVHASSCSTKMKPQYAQQVCCHLAQVMFFCVSGHKKKKNHHINQIKSPQKLYENSKSTMLSQRSLKEKLRFSNLLSPNLLTFLLSGCLSDIRHKM